jgi:hypothetical protein
VTPVPLDEDRFPILTRKRALAFLVITALLSIGIVTLLLAENSDATAETGHWPPLTMVYEMDGPSWNSVLVREVHRLEYRSTLEWTDTVIESDSIESLALGTVSTAGSYSRLKGARYEDYNSITDQLDVSEIDEDTIFVPNAFMMPFHISEIKKAQPGDLTEIASVSTVCYRGDCEQNAGRLLHNRGDEGWVYANELRWGIPLKVGYAFLVRKLEIDSPRQ